MTDRAVALLLACSLALLLAGFHRSSFSSSDEAGAYEITRSLVEDGSLKVPALRHSYVGRDGGRYSHFAIGQSLLAIPFYQAGRLARAWLPESVVDALSGPGARLAQVDRSYRGPEIFFVLLYPPLVTGLLIGVFFLFERRLGASRESALLASGVLGLGSYIALMSTFFLRHVSESLLVLAAFFCFFRYAESGRTRFAAAGSLLASLLLLVRVPSTVAGVALAGYLLWVLAQRARDGGIGRDLLAVGTPFVLVLAVHLALNQAMWGAWLDSPMVQQRSFFAAPSPRALFGLLGSPGAGLLWYTPALVLAPLALHGLWQRHRAEAATVIAVFVLLWLFIASFQLWHGLWASPGPRYLTACIPLLLLPLGPWLDGGARRRRAAIVLGGVGAVVQLGLMTTHWWSLVEVMDYPSQQPGFGFLFAPSQSPIVAALELRWQGLAGDSWWSRLATGWPGEPGRPGAALGIAAIWMAALAALTRRLWRVVTAERASPEASG